MRKLKDILEDFRKEIRLFNYKDRPDLQGLILQNDVIFLVDKFLEPALKECQEITTLTGRKS